MARLLDLFCGAGGCSVGYARAGFEVVGVDIEPHPDYPFELIVADALAVLKDRALLRSFDVVAESPPCPGYSTMTADPERHPRLIAPTRELLKAAEVPYVIENVEGAFRYMDHPVVLCGRSFGLRVRRHRLFESNRFLMSPGCHCARSRGQALGVYGHHGDRGHTYLRPNGASRGVKAANVQEAQQALGIDWMTDWDDLTDAIPPAYTEYIGTQLLDQLAAVA